MTTSIFEKGIIQNILIPTNKNPITVGALDYIVSLFPDANYFILGVVDITGESTLLYTSYSSDHLDVLEKLEMDAINEIKSQLEKKEVKVLDSKILYGHPTNAILKYSKKKNINLIVLATTSKVGTEMINLGSTAKGVIVRTRIPVLLLPPNAKLKPVNIVLNPSTFSKYSFRASLLALSFAKHFNASVKVLQIGEKYNEGMLNPTKEYAENEKIPIEFIQAKSKSSAKDILDLAKQCDIMIASRGRRGLSYKFRYLHPDFSLGKVEITAISLSEIPVILINE